MIAMHKKMLNIITVLSIVFICCPSQVTADGPTMFRKGLGVVGSCMVVNGLWKIAKKRPGQGLLRMLGGVVVAFGGFCSDIIYNRVVSLARRVRDLQQWQERTRTGFTGYFQNMFEDLHYGAEVALQGGAATVGNALQADAQMKDGWRTFKGGNLIAGVDQMYDGAYHNVRARCRMALHPELWQQQQ